MLTPRNTVILQGGLVRDPDVNEDVGVVSFSLAIDGSGSEKGVKNASGYFDIKVWMNESEYTPVAVGKYVKQAITDKTLRKGARVSLVGRLVQERWEKDGKKSTRVIVTAESIDIYNSQARGGASGSPAGATGSMTSSSSSSTADFSEF